MKDQRPTYETLPPDIKERYGINDNRQSDKPDLAEELAENDFAKVLNRSHLNQ